MEKDIDIQAIYNDQTYKQKLALQELRNPVRRIVLYGGAAGGGKSWLGCTWLFLSAFCCSGTRWFIGRNRLKDCRQSVLITFDKVCKAYGFAEGYRYKDDEIHFYNGSVIQLIDLSFYPKKDPFYERFGSLEFTGGWIEEASEVHALAFDVLKSRIGRHLNDESELEPKMLITCNPKKNWLYKLIYRPSKEGTLDKTIAFVPALVTDNPFIGKDYIEMLSSISSKAQRMRLLQGLWEYEDNQNSLIDYDALLDCFTNNVQTSGMMRLSADVALKGRDKFIAWRWRGLCANLAINLPYCTADQAEMSVRSEAEKNNISRSNIVADSDGVGAYLSDYYKGIKEFHGGESAHDKRYFNLKSECAYKLAEFINKRQLRIICPDELVDTIADELDTCLVANDIDADTSKLRIISKEEQKQTLGHSPDYFDALNMGMYWHVVPQPRGVSMAIGRI
jgi:phage terminase large subunit